MKCWSACVTILEGILYLLILLSILATLATLGGSAGGRGKYIYIYQYTL